VRLRTSTRLGSFSLRYCRSTSRMRHCARLGRSRRVCNLILHLLKPVPLLTLTPLTLSLLTLPPPPRSYSHSPIRHYNLWALRDCIVQGQRPTEGDTEAKRALAVAPGGAVVIMKECWAADPSRRPSGFEEIVDGLESVLDAVRSADTASTRPSVTASTRPEGLDTTEYFVNPMIHAHGQAGQAGQAGNATGEKEEKERGPLKKGISHVRDGEAHRDKSSKGGPRIVSALSAQPESSMSL
jgi:hypothetical protein